VVLAELVAMLVRDGLATAGDELEWYAVMYADPGTHARTHARGPRPPSPLLPLSTRLLASPLPSASVANYSNKVNEVWVVLSPDNPAVAAVTRTARTRQYV
jgi:hypothetical protein